MGACSEHPTVIDVGFPLTQHDWDFNSAKGKEHLKFYHQALLATAWWPRNLTKVHEV